MTKIELFDKELQENAAVFKALSNPARLAILRYLSETKTCISGDISDELPLSRTTVHQHLEELKTIGLIKGEIQGSKKKYCLDQDKIREVRQMMDAFMGGLNSCSQSYC